MSQYYSGKRTRNIFDPSSKEPFNLSRSKIDNFLTCTRCFYMDRKLGVGQPPGFPFNLNSAVDTLLKKEFDIHRMQQSRHPLMESYGVDAVPFEHEKIEEWRDTFKGVQYYDEGLNMLFMGAVDDIWEDPDGTLIVVDYKATSKDGEVTLDAPWQDGYKRQMEIYQWLLRMNRYSVSSTGYFVYCNGQNDREGFNGKLDFDISLIPYKGDDSWVEKTVNDIHACLINERIPDAKDGCDFCAYRTAVGDVSKINTE